ncbi:MAG: fluoride efflux transporter CrcB [Selenomonadaceae bacterium]|nr:fluoride efflux transporter CrcB [Selenomonadaceae bacterium]
MIKFLLVFLGGGLGAMLRYFISSHLAEKMGTFPIGTLTVNIIGNFLMGVLFEIFLTKEILKSDMLNVFFTVGFLGGFTSLSAFSAETLELMHHGEMTYALINILATFSTALISCAAGWTLVQKLF